MALTDTDKLLVSDGSTTETITFAQLKEQTVLNDSDKLLVNDGTKTETVTWGEMKSEIGPPETAPEIASVSLVESNPDADPRFTSQEFVASVSMTEEGTPVSTKKIDAYVEGSITQQVQFDEPLESTGSSSTNYGQYLSNISNPPNPFNGDPGDVFDGSAITGVNTTNNGETIQWLVPEEFQNSGSWGVTVDRPNSSYYWEMTLTNDGVVNDTVNSDGAQYINLSTGFNYSVKKIIIRSNAGVPTGLREIYHDNKKIIDSTTTSLNFAAGTDMSTLAAGDAVKQAGSNDYASKLSIDAGNWIADRGPEKAFNGNVTDFGEGAETENGCTKLTFDCSGDPLGGDIRVYSFAQSANPATIKIYTGSSSTPEATGTINSGIIDSVLFTGISNCTKIEIERGDAPNLWGISVNNVLLLDDSTGTVDSVDNTTKTVTLSSSSGTWTNGTNVTGPEKTVTIADDKKYLKFDSSGTVSDLLDAPQSPAYETTGTNPSLTFKFPATFPSGNAPDDELGDGTKLVVEVTATNTAGSDGPKTAEVQPEGASGPALGGLTTLWPGNGSTQTITNGIDLVNNDGLVWIKNRGPGTAWHELYDTLRGPEKVIYSNDSGINSDQPNGVTAFNENGFTLGNGGGVNGSGSNIVGWTFAKHEGFFDVVKYTGNGATNVVPHNLGAVPACMIVKNLGAFENWMVYHKDLPTPERSWLQLNNTSAVYTNGNDQNWAGNKPDASNFYVGNSVNTNQSGVEHIAYLFADTAGTIKCGSTPSDTSVDLGFEPQWILIKTYSIVNNWLIYDSTRGWNVFLQANSDQQEIATQLQVSGNTFTIPSGTLGSGSWIYVAIAKPSTRSLTQEEFTQQAAKFATYNNRRDVHQGEQAMAQREALYKQLETAGVDPPAINKLLGGTSS